jgi:hypothetical protein
MGTTLQRLLVRSLGAMVCVLAVLAGCISFVFRVNALPVAKILVRSDTVVAYWMVGGAVGPHYTEFRDERSALPGVLLARVIGYSANIGSVVLSVTAGNTPRQTTRKVGRGISLNAPWSRCYHGKPRMSHLLLIGRSNGFRK